MIQIETIKTFILNTLGQTDYKFKIFTDAGEFQKAVRHGNAVEEYINGCLIIADTDTETLSGGEVAVAVETTLEFVIPVDEAKADGVYQDIVNFREDLSAAFEKATKISFTDDAGHTYTGGVSYSLPTSGEIAIRQGVGLSYTYICSISVAYIKNGVNTADVRLLIDKSPVSFMSINFSRVTSYIADTYKTAGDVSASGYGESAAFTIKFTVPALQGVESSTAIGRYLLGFENPNTPHRVELIVPGLGTKDIPMIFGNCESGGSGVSNLSYNVSLVPYKSEEITGG